MLASFAFLIACLGPQQGVAGGAAVKGPSILGLHSQPSVPRFGVEELTVDLEATYDRPFDPRDISLEAEVTPPSGKKYIVPGFIYQGYSRSLKNDKEVLTPKGPRQWRVRIPALEVGAQQLALKLKDRSGTATRMFSFEVTPSDDRGFIRVNQTDRRYFVFDNGRSYFPLGTNLCWTGDRGLYDYEDWFHALGAYGANYARLFLDASASPFALVRSGRPLAELDLANAWRLDEALALAQKNGIYVSLVLDTYQTLRNEPPEAGWSQAPENRDNGGPLRIWREFWTSGEMDRLYLQKLRYLAARYGAESHLFAWELWNDVDRVSDYDVDEVKDWQQRMAGELRGFDPGSHLISSSFANSMGDRAVDLLPETDFVQSHCVADSDFVWAVAYQQSRKSEWGKPHFASVVAPDLQDPHSNEDTDGLQVHDPLWIALAGGASGSGMPWWWDRVLAAKDLYSLIGAAAKFSSQIDWIKEAFRQTDVTLAYADSATKPTWKDLELDRGQVSFDPGPTNRPTRARVANGVLQGGPIPGILHGMQVHPDLHNPITLVVATSRPTRLSIFVGDVSGYGGATLQVGLDDARVMTKDLPAPDVAPRVASTHQFAGTYDVDIPAGEHSVRIENVGKDWVKVGFRLARVVPSSTPPLDAFAVTGNDMAIAWFRVSGRSWRRVVTEKRPPEAAPASVFGLSGLASGSWRIELWDTWKGVITEVRQQRVPIDGRIRVSLPVIDKDLAVKLVRTGP